MRFYFDSGHNPSFPRPDGSILTRDTIPVFRALTGAKNRSCPSTIKKSVMSLGFLRLGQQQTSPGGDHHGSIGRLEHGDIAVFQNLLALLGRQLDSRRLGHHDA